MSCRKAGLFFTMHGFTPSVYSLSNLRHLEQLFPCLPPLIELFETKVVISLSSWESVLLPLRCLKAVLFSYAMQTYQDLPVVELQPLAHDGKGERTGIQDPRSLAGVTS